MAAKITYDTDNRVILCNTGVITLDVREDLYSDAKEDWLVSGSLNKFRFPISPVGGDPIDETEGTYITSYFYLVNGWRVRPQEANHTLKVIGGVLLTEEGEDPFVATTGYYNVQVKYSQPIKSETLRIGSGLTQAEHNQLYAAALETTAQTISSSMYTVESKVGIVSSSVAEMSSSVSTVSSSMSMISSSMSVVSSSVAEVVIQTTIISSSVENNKGMLMEASSSLAEHISTAIIPAYEWNIRRTMILATEEDINRNVGVGKLDRIVFDIKATEDPDWSNPIGTYTLYAWYTNMGDVAPYKLGESD